MTIRDIIEAKAREERDKYLAFETPTLLDMARGVAIAILTDPQVGFKEALELVHNRPCGSCDAFPPCEGLPNGTCNGDPVDSCTCPCHTASAKLAELKELEKGK